MGRGARLLGSHQSTPVVFILSPKRCARLNRRLALGTWRPRANLSPIPMAPCYCPVVAERRVQIERFEAKFERQETGCWIWTRAKSSSNGYGKAHFGGRTLGAHRAAWEIYRGPIPPGLFVLHRCDVPLCVNPDHLFIGTQLDNVTDRESKGRTSRGAKHATSKRKIARELLVKPFSIVAVPVPKTRALRAGLETS